jgi:GT2 family glycosyltransferase
MSTCRLADRERDREITRVMVECVESFVATTEGATLVIVDDGSTDEHRAVIDGLAKRHPQVRTVFKGVNGGTARSKNTALRLFDESGADHAFLIDDDIVFVQADWQTAYIEAMLQTNYHFLSFFEDRTDTMIERDRNLSMESEVVTVQGVRLKTSPLVMGVFWAMDREVVRRVGGFRAFPRKYGHWHTEHNFRCLEAGLSGPSFTDIADSQHYLRLNTQASVYTDAEKLEMARENAQMPLRGQPRWAPLVE